jgi:hypothetical protein
MIPMGTLTMNAISAASILDTAHGCNLTQDALELLKRYRLLVIDRNTFDNKIAISARHCNC